MMAPEIRAVLIMAALAALTSMLLVWYESRSTPDGRMGRGPIPRAFERAFEGGGDADTGTGGA